MLKSLLIGSTIVATATLFTPTEAKAADRTVCGSNGAGPAGFFNPVFNGRRVQRGFWSWFKVTTRRGNCLKLFDESARKFQASWDLSGNGSDAVGGMGWSTGSTSRVIRYKMTQRSLQSGKISIGLYGWTCKDKIVEYYVVDSYRGSYFPFDDVSRREITTSLGTVSTDGGTYNIYRTRRTNAGNACGNNTDFDQYWSIRTSPLSSSNSTTRTITFQNHVNAWASKGLNLGQHRQISSGIGRPYQIMAVEGLNTSKGQVTIDVQ